MTTYKYPDDLRLDKDYEQINHPNGVTTWKTKPKEQPEALRLADALYSNDPKGLLSQAAAELRRLHALNQEWERKAATWLSSPEAAQRLDGYRELAQQVNALETLNQELLEALQKIKHHFDTDEYAWEVATAAIAKAQGASNE